MTDFIAYALIEILWGFLLHRPNLGLDKDIPIQTVQKEAKYCKQYLDKTLQRQQ